MLILFILLGIIQTGITCFIHRSPAIILLLAAFFILALMDIIAFGGIGSKKLAPAIEFLKGSSRENMFLKQAFSIDIICKSCCIMGLSLWAYATEAMVQTFYGGWFKGALSGSLATGFFLILILGFSLWLNRKTPFFHLALSLCSGESVLVILLFPFYTHASTGLLLLFAAAGTAMSILSVYDILVIRKKGYYDEDNDE